MTEPSTSKKSVTRSKYQLLMQLGAGGMATAHLAMSRGPRGFVKLFVLKMLQRQLLFEGDARSMFLEEARLCARLAHPNIVQVFEVIEYDGVPTIVMEYLEGQALSSILRDDLRHLPLDLHLYVISKLLAGLHGAHELTGFDGTALSPVHRDVSPHNVFVQYDGQVKVLDFGIAKVKDSKVDTQTGVMKGKLRYMAPEQVAGEEQDRRVDVFAAGIMLWEALAGERMWANRSDAEVIVTLLNDEPPPLPDDPRVPQPLRAVCARALRPAKEERYATAAELQRELDAYLAEHAEGDLSQRLGAFVAGEFTESRKNTNTLISAAIKVADSASQAPSENPTRIEPIAIVQPRRSASRRSLVLVGVGAFTLAVALATFLGAASRQRTAASASSSSAKLECSANEKSCSGECTSRDRPDHGCGAAGCLPCLTPNATSRCNGDGHCDIALCHKGFDDCDNKPDNGCESNVRIDPDNCGSCRNRCPELPHAERGCGDVCTIWRCQPGYRDCNGDVQDGCELSVLSDNKNCGHCGAACAPGQRCQGGHCG